MVKHLTKILVLSLFLFTCCKDSEGNNAGNNIETNNVRNNIKDGLSRKALEKLYKIIAEENKNVELKDDEINIGNSKITVSVFVERELTSQGKYFFAARYETKLKESEEIPLIVGSIGIGEDKNDAVETSMDEWVALFGKSLSQMLSNSEKGISIENFTIYPGLMGIRGEDPTKSWIDGSPTMNKKILNSLIAVFKKSDQKVTSINLALSVNKNGELAGECRMNNDVSQELCDELKKLDWDSKAATYMFKQFYLIKKSKV